MSRIKGWTRLSSKELWYAWRAQFESDDEAIAVAIWTGNRLVKDRAKSTRRKFYSLKDAWIKRNQTNLMTGMRVRKEYLACRKCVGVGKLFEGRAGANYWDFENWLSGPGSPQHAEFWGRRWTGGKPDIEKLPEGWYVSGDCPKRSGTGKYRTWWLYLHVFDICGQQYSFHSYVRPKQLSDELGEDCERYGGRFTEDELDELALPVTGLIKFLGYVAHDRWGLAFSRRAGKYV